MLLGKRIFGIVIAVVCIMALATVNVSAASVNDAPLPSHSLYKGAYMRNTSLMMIGGIYDKPLKVASYEITPYDNNPPAEVWDLSTKGAYTVNGSSVNSAVIYTMYKFTTSSGKINYTFTSGNQISSFKVYRYKNGTGLIHRKTLCTLEPGETVTGTISDLSSDDFIVFGFTGACNITGTITQ